MNEEMEREFDSSKMWRETRYKAGVSQEYLANYIGVSRKTIQNWESGVSAPNFNQGAKWFEALGINPLPYYLAYIYPQNFEDISAASEDKKINAAVHEIVDNLPMEGERELLYLFYGSHGSSPRSVLNLLTAYLHLPMQSRVILAKAIMSAFEVAELTGNLVSDDHIGPNVENVKNAIESALEAVKNRKEAY